MREREREREERKHRLKKKTCPIDFRFARCFSAGVFFSLARPCFFTFPRLGDDAAREDDHCEGANEEKHKRTNRRLLFSPLLASTEEREIGRVI